MNLRAPNNVLTTVLFFLFCRAANAQAAISPSEVNVYHAPMGGQLTIQGTWAGRNVMQTLAKKFEQQPTGGYITYLPRDSFQVVSELTHRELGLGLVLDSQVPSVGEKLGFKFEKYVLGRFVVVVVVNAKNPTQHITTDELAKIYQGKIGLWQKIEKSEHAGNIELYAPLLAKTEGCVFQARVLKGDSYAEKLRGVSGESDRQKITSDEVVAAVAKDRNAIGFLLYGYGGKLDKRVRILAIAKDTDAKPVPPSVQSIRDGSYPLWDTLSLYLHPDAPPLAQEFCQFATSAEAAPVVKAFRLLPDYVWQQQVGKLRLSEMVAGQGEPIMASGTFLEKKLVQDLAAEFVKVKTTIQLRYQRLPQAEAVKKFLNGGDLLFIDGSLDKGMMERYGDQWDANKPQSFVLGRMVVGIVVHPTNPIKSMSLQELKDIYTGRMANWSELKGLSGPIRLYGLSSNNPCDTFFREALGVSRLMGQVVRRSDTAKVLAVVARDASAIGFVDLGGLTANDSSVKLLPLISSEKPFAVSARGGEDYPLAKPYRMYISSKANNTVQEFVRFLALGNGAEAITQHGLLPSVVRHNMAASRR